MAAQHEAEQKLVSGHLKTFGKSNSSGPMREDPKHERIAKWKRGKLYV